MINTLNKDQKQDATSGSTAIQVGGDLAITVSGITYTAAREVALQVFKENFYKLSRAAEEVADSRAKQVTEDFLKKLQEQNRPRDDKCELHKSFQNSVFLII